MADAAAPWNTPQTREAWSALAKQLPPSKGEFAGPASTKDGGKQWMRAMSLVVYKAGTGSGADQDYGGGKDLPKAPDKPGVPALDPEHPPPTRAARADPPPSTELPEVAVTAPTAKPQQEEEKPSEGLELGALRVSFNVHKSTVTTAGELDARIYNLSPATMKKVIQFTRVKLSAGYKYGQFGVIFDGKVVQYRHGKENPTDTYLEIKAFDGDPLSQAITHRRAEAGTKESDVLQQLIKDTGIPAGHISPTVGTQVLVRPWVMAGPTQKYLRDLMLKYNANAFPDVGKLHVVPQTEYKPGEAVVLSPRTGLVGIPEATPEGIQIRCLLNPKIQLCGLIKLDNKLISGVAFIPGGKEIDQSTFYSGQVSDATLGQKVEMPVPTSPTGTYKIYMMEYTGDTRGQPWYTDMICIALDASNQPIVTDGSVFKRQPSAAPPTPGAAPAPKPPPAKPDKPGVPALDPEHPPPT
jgi:hypothetical protein